jgi:hypothetical protein
MMHSTGKTVDDREEWLECNMMYSTGKTVTNINDIRPSAQPSTASAQVHNHQRHPLECTNMSKTAHRTSKDTKRILPPSNRRQWASGSTVHVYATTTTATTATNATATIISSTVDGAGAVIGASAVGTRDLFRMHRSAE